MTFELGCLSISQQMAKFSPPSGSARFLHKILYQGAEIYKVSEQTVAHQQLWDFSLSVALKSRQNLITAVNRNVFISIYYDLFDKR
jgi:N-acetylmuramoyl-L-alanine amidase